MEVTKEITVRGAVNEVQPFSIVIDTTEAGLMTFAPSCGCTTINRTEVTKGVNVVNGSISASKVGEFTKSVSWGFYQNNILKKEGKVIIHQIVT